MAVRVGDCIVVQRMERAGRAGPAQGGVFLARDELRHLWVILDVRREEALQLPDERLDDELAGRAGVLAPMRRTRDRARGIVGLVEPLRPRRSLFAHGPLDPRTAAVLFADLVTDLDGLADADVSLGLLTSHDLVLVDSGAGARLLVCSFAARRASSSVMASRNLVAVLSVLPLVTDLGSDERWAALVRPLVTSAQAGELSATQAAGTLREFAGDHEARVVVPAPPQPPDAALEELADAGIPQVAEVGPGRRVGPLEIGLGLLGLVAAAVVVVLAQPTASGLDPAGGGATSRDPGTPAATPTASRTQPPPADQPLVGRACAFYDVGVLDRSGTAVLQCVRRDDGTYVWQNRA